MFSLPAEECARLALAFIGQNSRDIADCSTSARHVDGQWIEMGLKELPQSVLHTFEWKLGDVFGKPFEPLSKDIAEYHQSCGPSRKRQCQVLCNDDTECESAGAD